MTMQDGPSGFGGIGDITWDDLRPDLVARFHRRHSLPAAQNHASPQDPDEPDSPALGRALLESLGLTQAGTPSGGSVPNPEALLLFGTEEAIARHFPFLKTRVSLRDLSRNREKTTDLPGNIPECLEALGRFVASELPSPSDHASLRDAAVLPWLFEMAVSRDYTQTRVARLVRDRDHVFLEYPRQVAFGEDAGASFIRYVRSMPIEAVLSRLYPTLAGEITETGEAGTAAGAREHAYFGLPALRIEGRFFKIMATLPHQDLHGTPTTSVTMQDSRVPDGEAPVAPDSGRREKTGKPGIRTMQALRTVTTRIKTWLRRHASPKPSGSQTLAPPPAPYLAPTTPSSGAGVGQVAPSRPAPHPGSPGQPPYTLPSVLDPYPPKKASPNGTRPTVPPSPNPRAERPDAADRTARILAFCSAPRHRDEIQKHVGMNNRDHFRKEVLNRLIAQGLLAPTLPDKPNSPKQQYVTRTA